MKLLIRFLLAAVLISQNVLGQEPFPLARTVEEVKEKLSSGKVEATKLEREDYLAVVSGIVDYFQHFQAGDGRIIDPFLHKEFQYSTPCYAWAATALVASGTQTNLIESAARALECALQDLAADKAAMNHGDFYTFPLMMAYEHLRERVSPERRQKWEALLKSIDPQKCYTDIIGDKRTVVHNWNVVALSGEFLRYQNGFTDTNFVERYLGIQLPHFTAMGLYQDPNVPMAYDHFPRHFLAAILERGYDGQHRAELEELLNRAAWTSLLMQSPSGELPTGGRSAQHQWNEAEQCVTFEIWAKRRKRAQDKAGAEAFKRAAHLSLRSIQRWVRPSGELWIVKNRFDPSVRHGFQNYSSHSQYNLLAASMLSTAWLFADDDVTEGACPAEVGGFAFQVPEFHKIFANAGGMYLEIETKADPEYNSTGLIRVHKTGVEPLIGPTDASPMQEKPLALGVAWRNGQIWQSLAELGEGEIKKTDLRVIETKPAFVKFSVSYILEQAAVHEVIETYEVNAEEIRVSAEVKGNIDGLKVRFPAFIFDGEQSTGVSVSGAAASVTMKGCRQNFSVETRGVKLHRTGEMVSSRNGFLEAVEGEVAGRQVVYTMRPERLKKMVVPTETKPGAKPLSR